MQKILVVEDDIAIRNFVTEYLEENGYSVSTAGDGEQMWPILSKEDIDLIIMDLSLPGEDGLDLARKIRTTSQVPIIMVTGRGGTIDRIVGLEIGADDYLPKPFEPRELLARVKTVLRRFDASGNTRGGDSNSYSKATFGDWSLNLKNHNLISPEGVNTHLTSAEFDLLCVFINNPDRVLSRDRLIDLVYGREMSPFERSIDVLIMRLRSKIEKDRHNPSKIRTIRGQGYLFSPKVEWS